LKSKTKFLLVAISTIVIVFSSFLAVEVIRLQNEIARLQNEITTLGKEVDDFWLYSIVSDRQLGFVTKSIREEPVESREQAIQIYLMLIDRSPMKDYWIFYLAEDEGLPLDLAVSETDYHYCINGTFRNFAVNCPNAKIIIAYTIFKNGTATLKSVETICYHLDGGEDIFQLFP
jgi:hypothetical protein